MDNQFGGNDRADNFTNDPYQKITNTENEQNLQNAGSQNQEYKNTSNFVMYDAPEVQEPGNEEQPQPVRNPVHHVNNNPYSSYQFADTKKMQNRKKKKKRGGVWKKAVAFVLAAVLFGGISGSVFLGLSSLRSGTREAGSQDTPSISTTDTNQSSDTNVVVSDVSEVVEAAMPSIVSITTMTVQEVQNFFGQSQQYESASSGSGIIVGQNDKELLIATNHHVIEKASTLTVCFYDKKNDNTNEELTAEAKVKGSDPSNDLAVIAVQLKDVSAETLNQIKIATLGDSESLTVGEPAIAIGNALGYGQSVTSGVISAVEREVIVENEDGSQMSYNAIQTDAAINPGNSGGALLNIKGEVIGINSVKANASQVEGMGYAIPISEASPILSDLMEKKTRDKVDTKNRGYIGISPADVTSEAAERYDMPAGVYVKEVIEGGGAEKAGMLKGDIITKFDGAAIDSYETLMSTLDYYKAGEKIKIVVQRQDKNMEYNEVEIEVTLGESSTTE